MTKEFWQWLILSDEGLLYRIGLGCAILAIFAFVEINSKGFKASRRWREYLFLLSVMAAAVAYAVLNDQVTCMISWEYFYNHDDATARALGPLAFGEQPAIEALRLAAMKMAAKGAWTAGLLIGVAMLIANNPSRRRALPQITYGRLYRMLMIPLTWSLGLSVILGLAGYFGLMNFLSPEVVSLNVMRPPRFLCVQAAHLGIYAGGLIGAVSAVVAIRKRRRQLADAAAAAPSSSAESL